MYYLIIIIEKKAGIDETRFCMAHNNMTNHRQLMGWVEREGERAFDMMRKKYIIVFDWGKKTSFLWLNV